MHRYRTHTCGELREAHADQTVRLSGWVHRKRDHGNLLFLDLRDHYGISQVVLDIESPQFAVAEGARPETVITVTGRVVRRSPETVNDKLPTGRVEVQGETIEVQSVAAALPLQVSSDEDYGEEVSGYDMPITTAPQ